MSLIPERYNAGESVVRCGQLIDCMHVIFMGCCVMRAMGGRHISTFSAGDYFGEFNVIRKHVSKTNVVCLDFSELWCLNKDALDTILISFPQIKRMIDKMSYDTYHEEETLLNPSDLQHGATGRRQPAIKRGTVSSGLLRSLSMQTSSDGVLLPTTMLAEKKDDPIPILRWSFMVTRSLRRIYSLDKTQRIFNRITTFGNKVFRNDGKAQEHDEVSTADEEESDDDSSRHHHHGHHHHHSGHEQHQHRHLHPHPQSHFHLQPNHSHPPSDQHPYLLQPHPPHPEHPPGPPALSSPPTHALEAAAEVQMLRPPPGMDAAEPADEDKQSGKLRSHGPEEADRGCNAPTVPASAKIKPSIHIPQPLPAMYVQTPRSRRSTHAKGSKDAHSNMLPQHAHTSYSMQLMHAKLSSLGLAPQTTNSIFSDKDTMWPSNGNSADSTGLGNGQGTRQKKSSGLLPRPPSAESGRRSPVADADLVLVGSSFMTRGAMNVM